MPRKRVNTNETPAQRFKRVAEARTNAAIDKIRLLGNLADKRRYDYTPQDIDKMFSAIKRQLKEMRTKFGPRRRERFQL